MGGDGPARSSPQVSFMLMLPAACIKGGRGMMDGPGRHGFICRHGGGLPLARGIVQRGIAQISVIHITPFAGPALAPAHQEQESARAQEDQIGERGCFISGRGDGGQVVADFD